MIEKDIFIPRRLENRPPFKPPFISKKEYRRYWRVYIKIKILQFLVVAILLTICIALLGFTVSLIYSILFNVKK